MVDYIYIKIDRLSKDELLNNPLLDFVSSVNLKTGEIVPNSRRRKRKFKPRDEKEALYNHCLFTITNEVYLNFSGSLHEYFYSGDNSGDFKILKLFLVINDLWEKFKINPHFTVLHNIEFGVNILLPFPAKEFLDSIVSLKGKEYSRENYQGRGDHIRFSFGQFEVKIYDKGKQKFMPNNNLLRFEIKVRRMDFFKTKKIHLNTMADLLNPSVHTQLLRVLLHYCNCLIINDNSIDWSRPNEKETIILKEGNNPRFWKDLKASNPECYKKRVVRFNQLINKYSNRHMKKLFLDLVTEKWNQLTAINTVDLLEVNRFLEELAKNNFPYNDSL